MALLVTLHFVFDESGQIYPCSIYHREMVSQGPPFAFYLRRKRENYHEQAFHKDSINRIKPGEWPRQRDLNDCLTTQVLKPKMGIVRSQQHLATETGIRKLKLSLNAFLSRSRKLLKYCLKICILANLSAIEDHTPITSMAYSDVSVGLQSTNHSTPYPGFEDWYQLLQVRQKTNWVCGTVNQRTVGKCIKYGIQGLTNHP